MWLDTNPTHVLITEFDYGDANNGANIVKLNLNYTFDPKLIWDLEVLIKRYIKKLNLIYNPLIYFPGLMTECYKLREN